MKRYYILAGIAYFLGLSAAMSHMSEGGWGEEDPINHAPLAYAALFAFVAGLSVRMYERKLVLLQRTFFAASSVMFLIAAGLYTVRIVVYVGWMR